MPVIKRCSIPDTFYFLKNFTETINKAPSSIYSPLNIHHSPLTIHEYYLICLPVTDHYASATPHTELCYH